MDKTGIKELAKIQKEINKFKTKAEALIGMLVNLKGEIELVKNKEEIEYSNLPESLQESERSDLMQNAIDAMDNAMNSINKVVSKVENCIDEIDTPLEDAVGFLQEAIEA